MANYGELHNEMITNIMSRVNISSDMTKEQKKEILLQEFLDSNGTDNQEIIEQGLGFNTPYEIIDAIKEKISLNFHTVLKQDLDYLLESENVNYEEYFNERLVDTLDGKELELYRDCSSIFISSVQLWSSEEGMNYNDTLYTPDTAARRPPTRNQVVGMIGAHDWVGGVFGGILGGPFGVVVGAAAASASAAMSHSIRYN
jgi:hypothetical protein